MSGVTEGNWAGWDVVKSGGSAGSGLGVLGSEDSRESARTAIGRVGGGRQAPGSVGCRSVGGVGGAMEGFGSSEFGIGLATPLVEPIRIHSASK